MHFLKKLEAELIIEWQLIQHETDAGLKAIALRIYYAKYRLFKRSQAWHLELQAPVP